VAAIPAWLGDAAKSEGRPTRLKLASELLQVETGFNNTQRANPSVFKLALLQRRQGKPVLTSESKPFRLQAIGRAAPDETGLTSPKGQLIKYSK